MLKSETRVICLTIEPTRPSTWYNIITILVAFFLFFRNFFWDVNVSALNWGFEVRDELGVSPLSLKDSISIGGKSFFNDSVIWLFTRDIMSSFAHLPLLKRALPTTTLFSCEAVTGRDSKPGLNTHCIYTTLFISPRQSVGVWCRTFSSENL